MKTKEVVIRFKKPLRRIESISPDQPLEPISSSENRTVGPPKNESNPPVMVQPLPENFWETEIAAALEADRKMIRSALEKISQEIQLLQDQEKARMEEWQQAAIELGLTIATRICHQQITKNEFSVEAMVQDIVGQFEQQFPDDVPVRIRLHPQDVDLVEQRLQGEPLFAPSSGLTPELIADARINRGCCRVEGKEQSLLGEITEQIIQIRAELMGGLGQHAGT